MLSKEEATLKSIFYSTLKVLTKIIKIDTLFIQVLSSDSDRASEWYFILGCSCTSKRTIRYFFYSNLKSYFVGSVSGIVDKYAILLLWLIHIFGFGWLCIMSMCQLNRTVDKTQQNTTPYGRASKVGLLSTSTALDRYLYFEIDDNLRSARNE